MMKARRVAGVGVFWGAVGLDNMTGIARLSFDIPELLDRLGIVPKKMVLS
jgi:TctA family transporter